MPTCFHCRLGSPCFMTHAVFNWKRSLKRNRDTRDLESMLRTTETPRLLEDTRHPPEPVLSLMLVVRAVTCQCALPDQLTTNHHATCHLHHVLRYMLLHALSTTPALEQRFSLSRYMFYYHVVYHAMIMKEFLWIKVKHAFWVPIDLRALCYYTMVRAYDVWWRCHMFSYAFSLSLFE